MEIRYEIERGRRLKLTDIRITGTNKLTYDDVAADLRTQKASAIGLIPFLGYGRGYTSLTLLEQDRRTIESYMRDIGYRRVETKVLQGVSVNGESLIITFEVNEGPLTRIAGVEVRGNKIYTDQRLRDQLKTVMGAPYSRSQARADGDRVLALYATRRLRQCSDRFFRSRAAEERRRRAGQAALHNRKRRRQGLHQPDPGEWRNRQPEDHATRSAKRSCA